MATIVLLTSLPSLIATSFPTSKILQLLYMVPQYFPNSILSKHTIKFQLNSLISQRQLLALHLVCSNLCACPLAFAMRPRSFNNSWTRCFAVLERFQKYGIVVNPSKCKLGVATLEFLGHKVSEHGIEPLEERIQALQQFPLPDNQRKLREFLGLINFCTELCRHFATTQCNAFSSSANDRVLSWTQLTTDAFKQGDVSTSNDAISHQARCSHIHFDGCKEQGHWSSSAAEIWGRLAPHILFFKETECSRNQVQCI